MAKQSKPIQQTQRKSSKPKTAPKAEKVAPVYNVIQLRACQSPLPAEGFLRLPQIIGNPNAEPPIAPLYPVKKSSWWAGIKKGIYPKPVKIGARAVAWRVEDIRALIANAGNAANDATV